MTLDELATASGIDAPTLSRLENGRRLKNIGLDRICRLAEALKTTPAELLEYVR